MHKINVPNKLLEAHKAQAFVITCMDFRFREATQSFVAEGLGIKNFDLVAVPGAAKGVIEKTATGEVGSTSAEIAERLHRVTKVIFVNHGTCGAYSIPDAEKELERQSADLTETRRIFSEQFPTLSIRSFFAQKNDGAINYLEIQ